MSVLPFILNRGTNADLTPYSTTAAQALLTEARALLGTATRALRDFLYFDGLSAGGRHSVALGVAGDGLGTPGSRWTISRWVQVPTTAATRSIWCVSSAATGGSYSGNAIKCYLHSTDVLRVDIGDNSGANRRYLATTGSGLVAQYAGLWVLVTITHDGTSAQPLVYINGLSRAVTADVTAGSGPAWNAGFNDDYLTDGALDGGALWQGGQIPSTPINAVLSATEILTQAQTGRLPDYCTIGTGSMVPAYASTFAATADSWTNNNAGMGQTGNIDSVSGVDDAVRYTPNSADTDFSPIRSTTLNPRWKYRVTLDYYADTGCGIAYLGLGVSSGRRHIGDNIAVVEGSWQSIEFYCDPTVQSASLPICGYTTLTGAVIDQLVFGKNFYFKNIRAYPIAPVAKLVVQPVAVTADYGANRIAGVLTSGVTPVTDKRDWVIHGKTVTNGNQQLLGTSVFFDYTKHSIDTWDMKTAGTPTVYLGSGSGDNAYLGAGALAARVNPAALVKRYLVSSALWVNSTTTDEIVHTVRGHLCD